jgi:AcrR family transcriptional regulator
VGLARRAELGELKRKRTRAALLQAAASVLGAEAGRLATVDSVYAAAGLARGTFYNHFSGREQFIEAAAFELSHEFNTSIEACLPKRATAAVRASIWMRHYLRRVRADRQWGWVLVNTSLNGRRVFGEESYHEARSTIELGCAAGVFKVGNQQAALDLALGSVLVAAEGRRTRLGTRQAGHPAAAPQARMSFSDTVASCKRSTGTVARAMTSPRPCA